MKVLRTPDECFEDLEGYAFAPHYTEVKDEDGTPIRIHHVDEGPRDAAPILLMHGNPTWAYLYRKFVPPLVAAGHRVVAMDLVGCGRSDTHASSPPTPVCRSARARASRRIRGATPSTDVRGRAELQAVGGHVPTQHRADRVGSAARGSALIHAQPSGRTAPDPDSEGTIHGAA